MRAEAELLVATVRSHFGTGSSEQVAAIANQVLDWGWVLRAGRGHGVMPFVCRELDAICPELVPANTLIALRDEFAAHRWRALQMTGALLRLSRALEDQGIPHVMLKGPTLAVQLYGDVTMRQSRDLDVLVSTQDVARAGHVLATLGYDATSPPSAGREANVLDAASEREFERGSTGELVELHWAFSPRTAAVEWPADGVIDRRAPVRVGNVDVSTPAAADAPLYLCLHGTSHMWERFAWICDVARTVQLGDELNWLAILDRATEMGIRRMLLVGLLLARDVVAVPVPEVLLTTTERADAARALSAKVIRRLFRRGKSTPGMFERAIFYAQTRERARDSVRYAWRVVTSPNDRDREWVRLPREMEVLYVVIRPLRLIKEHVVLRLVAGSPRTSGVCGNT